MHNINFAIKYRVFDAGIDDKKSIEITKVRDETKYEPRSPSALARDPKPNANKGQLENKYAFLIPKLTSSMIQAGKKISVHAHFYDHDETRILKYDQCRQFSRDF